MPHCSESTRDSIAGWWTVSLEVTPELWRNYGTSYVNKTAVEALPTVDLSGKSAFHFFLWAMQHRCLVIVIGLRHDFRSPPQCEIASTECGYHVPGTNTHLATGPSPHPPDGSSAEDYWKTLVAGPLSRASWQQREVLAYALTSRILSDLLWSYPILCGPS